MLTEADFKEFVFTFGSKGITDKDVDAVEMPVANVPPWVKMLARSREDISYVTYYVTTSRMRHTYSWTTKLLTKEELTIKLIKEAAHLERDPQRMANIIEDLMMLWRKESNG